MKKKYIIVLVLVGLLITGGLSFVIYKKYTNDEYLSKKSFINNIECKNMVLHDYSEYLEAKNNYELDVYLNGINFLKNNYLIVAENVDSCAESLEGVTGYEFQGNKLIINITVRIKCGYCAVTPEALLLPIDKDIDVSQYEIEYVYETISDPDLDCGDMIDKPVLYLYPEEDNTEVSITFENSEKLTTSYPKYINEWNVVANKNGDLYDAVGKYYYALYWEEQNTKGVSFKEGFNVSKNNAIEFLEDKLTYIGLNDKERNEFIMYWLPILEENGNSIVYFELTESKQENSKLIITPTPDSLLRVTMHVKKAKEFERIVEQKLEPFERWGFTVVEWGGVFH